MNKQINYIIYAVLITRLLTAGYFSFQIPKRGIVNPSVEEGYFKSKHLDIELSDSTILKGRNLFKSCAPCHTIFKDMTGPALAGVESRWPDKRELFTFIRNPGLVMSRNAYARKLKEKFGTMTPAFNLTDKQIQLILDYITYEETKSKPLPIAEKKPF